MEFTPLGKPGWLVALLERAGADHRASGPLAAMPPGPPGRARARAYLRRVLRESGLLYGTPALRTSGAFAERPPEERLFLAVIATFARIALDVAALTGAPAGPRREQLLALFAALCGRWEEAEEIQRELVQVDPLPRRLWSRVEAALEERALSLSGDPAYGLLLHNGAVYADASAFGRVAVDFFVRGFLSVPRAKRRLEACHRHKAVLAEVLTALACVERPPGFTSRRAILRQIEDLNLPAPLANEVRQSARRAFDRRRAGLPSVLRRVRSPEMKRFILEQTLLGSLVDGRRSPSELAFIQELAERLGVTREALSAFELEVAEFYRAHRDVVDVFTVSAGALSMAEEVLESVQDAVEKNFRRLMKEVRETGELSVLLAKAARGQSLSSDERRRMREQLIDVAKAVPALAIFAAPGGLFLLIALSKVLPFSLLPSSFQEQDQDERSRDG
ncbi:MAG TPA: LETM1 domain-containing protein [Myxococcales bacterium]|nr:LETM1 domain-containing protein [Myxococcales bacterium]